MPDEPTTDGEKTIAMSEYKKVQRELSRRDARIDELTSGIARLEALVEAQLGIAAQDEDLKPVVADVLQKHASRRTSDTESAQLTMRLNQLLDDTDADWGEDRFDEARKLLDEVNASGNFTRIGEVERLIEAAINPGDARSLSEQVAEAVAQALRGEQQTTKRVDLGASTAPSGPITRGELRGLDPQDGIAAMREKVNAALDQLSR